MDKETLDTEAVFSSPKFSTFHHIISYKNFPAHINFQLIFKLSIFFWGTKHTQSDEVLVVFINHSSKTSSQDEENQEQNRSPLPLPPKCKCSYYPTGNCCCRCTRADPRTRLLSPPGRKKEESLAKHLQSLPRCLRLRRLTPFLWRYGWAAILPSSRFFFLFLPLGVCWELGEDLMREQSSRRVDWMGGVLVDLRLEFWLFLGI